MGGSEAINVYCEIFARYLYISSYAYILVARREEKNPKD